MKTPFTIFMLAWFLFKLIMEVFLDLHHESTADGYHFKPLEANKGQFRLLKFLPDTDVSHLNISIQTFNRIDAPTYKALSYTWGSATNDDQGKGEVFASRTILLNGREFYTFENLYNALLELWLQETRNDSPLSPNTFYWVDAICIDQKNNIERGHQVNLMDAIYANATCVIVWLGLEKESYNTFTKDLITKTSALGKLLVHDAEMADTTGWTLWHESDEKRSKYCSSADVPPFTNVAWSCLLELFSRKWFSRLWVVQEVALAREVYVVCGSTQFLWDDFELTAEAFAAGLGSDVSQTWLNSEARDHFSTTITCLLHICRTRSWCQTNICPRGFEEYSILTGGVRNQRPYAPAILLVVLRFFQTTDERDKVFGILGLARALSNNKEEFLRADYMQTPIEVQRAASRRILQETGWLGFIHFAKNQPKVTYSDDSTAETTSWIIGSSPIRDAYFEKRFDAMRAGSSGTWKAQPSFSFVNSRSIKTSGIKICTVTGVGEVLRDFYNKSGQFNKTMEMIMTLDSEYKPTGQTRIEAAAEAMIESLLTGPILITSFHDWLLYILTNNSNSSNLRPTKRLIEEIAAFTGSMQVASIAEESKDYGAKAIPSELQAKSEIYGKHFYLISFRRRFYCTAEGLIGVGLESLQPGDEIWLLPRTCSPFAVRKVPGKGVGNHYTLVGPAFTLGAMYGEMLQKDNLWEEIILK